jgi:hypothetical protein
MFFFEKKNQKTFALARPLPGESSAATATKPNEQKFFGSFFQKRTFFTSSI